MSKGNNRKKGNSRSKNRGNTPTAVDRIDDGTIREVSLLLELGATDDLIRKQYKLCHSQIDFIRKHPQNWDIWESLTKNKEE